MKESSDTATAPQVRELLPVVGEETLDQPEDITVEQKVREGRGGRRLLREIIETVLLTVVIFVVINTLTGRFRIEGPSMRPTLYEGQYLIINKIEYKLHPPRRGDIVVFHHPEIPNRDLIKRVIGLPGEMVEMRQGRVYVDGVMLKEPYVVNATGFSYGIELGPDDFFVLGDNRPNSEDSRKWGVVKQDQIVGKAWISYWPPEHWGGVPHYGYPEDGAVQEQGARVDGE